MHHLGPKSRVPGAVLLQVRDLFLSREVGSREEQLPNALIAARRHPHPPRLRLSVPERIRGANGAGEAQESLLWVLSGTKQDTENPEALSSLLRNRLSDLVFGFAIGSCLGKRRGLEARGRAGLPGWGVAGS